MTVDACIFCHPESEYHEFDEYQVAKINCPDCGYYQITIEAIWKVEEHIKSESKLNLTKIREFIRTRNGVVIKEKDLLPFLGS